MDAERYWALATQVLGIGERDYLRLTPRLIHHRVEQWESEQRILDSRAWGAAVSTGKLLGGKSQTVRASDHFGFLRDPKPIDPEQQKAYLQSMMGGRKADEEADAQTNRT